MTHDSDYFRRRAAEARPPPFARIRTKTPKSPASWRSLMRRLPGRRPGPAALAEPSLEAS